MSTSQPLAVSSIGEIECLDTSTNEYLALSNIIQQLEKEIYFKNLKIDRCIDILTDTMYLDTENRIYYAFNKGIEVGLSALKSLKDKN